MNIHPTIEEVFFVYENADSTEGRGPMVIVRDSGFFLTEKEAWDFANTLGGIMGRKPRSGSWQKEQYPDVEVRKFLLHNCNKAKQKTALKKQIEDLQNQLKELER